MKMPKAAMTRCKQTENDEGRFWRGISRLWVHGINSAASSLCFSDKERTKPFFWRTFCWNPWRFAFVLKKNKQNGFIKKKKVREKSKKVKEQNKEIKKKGQCIGRNKWPRNECAHRFWMVSPYRLITGSFSLKTSNTFRRKKRHPRTNNMMPNGIWSPIQN